MAEGSREHAVADAHAQPHSDAALLDFLSSLLDYTPTVTTSLSLSLVPRLHSHRNNLCVCGRGDLKYWVHAHVLCVLLGFGEDICVCVGVRDVNVRWNCFDFHYGDDLYLLIACDRFRMNSPSITWAEVASTAPIFVCTCLLSSEPSLPGFFGLIIHLLQCVKVKLSLVCNYLLVLLLALNFPNFGILRYVGIFWFAFHVLQLLPIRFTQQNL